MSMQCGLSALVCMQNKSSFLIARCYGKHRQISGLKLTFSLPLQLPLLCKPLWSLGGTCKAPASSSIQSGMCLQCPKLGWEVEQGDANQHSSAAQVWQEEMTAAFSVMLHQENNTLLTLPLVHIKGRQIPLGTTRRKRQKRLV